MILRLFCTAALLSPAALIAQETPAAPAAAKRELKFHRPETKGTKYDYTMKASQTRTMDIHADEEVQPGGSQSLEVTLEGTMEVTEVTPQAGSVIGYTFTVKKMSLTDGSGADDGFEPGTVITAKVKDHEVTYFAHGGEVEGNLKEGLSLALPVLLGLDEPEDDSVMQPPGPVTPGEKWEMNKAKIAETLKKIRREEIDEAQSKAAAHYKGPATVAGMETDTIVTSVHLVYTKVGGLPDGHRLVSTTYTNDTTTALPRDEKLSAMPSTRSVSESKSRFAVKQEGREFEVEYKTHRESRQTVTPVK